VSTPADNPPHASPSGSIPRRPWTQLLQNRFWLVTPMLVLNLLLVNALPVALSPGSAGPDIPVWISLPETVLRVVVLGAPLLMPVSLRERPSRPVLTVYLVGLGAYIGAWVAVVWTPTSTWSTSLIGFTALAWPTVILFAGIGLRSTLRFVPDTGGGCTLAPQSSSRPSTRFPWRSSGTRVTDCRVQS
jgi:hypothetical protein